MAALADAWLSGAEVVPLEPIDQRNTIRRRDGTLIATRSGEPIYTTQTMLRLELGQGLAGLTFRAGDDFRNASIGAVSAARATDDDLPAPLAGVTDR